VGHSKGLANIELPLRLAGRLRLIASVIALFLSSMTSSSAAGPIPLDTSDSPSAHEVDHNVADRDHVYQAEDHDHPVWDRSGHQLLAFDPATTRVADTYGGKPSLYLTFDDGSSELTPPLLDVLDSYPDVRVTFFTNCKEAVSGTLQRIVDAGHAIGNHSCNHLYLTGLTSSEVASQLRMQEDFVNARLVSDLDIACYRPPFGATNTWLRSVTSRLGYREWTWSVDPQDWRYPGVDAIVRSLEGMGDGDVIVLHDSRGKSQTVEAVREFLAKHAHAYTFRTIPDCALGKPRVPGPFDDVAGDSAYASAIQWFKEMGYTHGCNAAGTRFCPNDQVTRGQMSAFMSRILSLPASERDVFVDDDGSMFESDIDRVGSAGIAKGCNPPHHDRFCPDGPVTRGQMAAFLVRAFGYDAGGGSNLFADDDGSLFEDDIDKLGTAGVTRGCNPPVNDRFCPDGLVTRAQMAVFLHRALQ
jgi:peptidoglycan/xylan/chitin deacetylase (PgdA/CDA1 family)